MHSQLLSDVAAVVEPDASPLPLPPPPPPPVLIISVRLEEVEAGDGGPLLPQQAMRSSISPVVLEAAEEDLVGESLRWRCCWEEVEAGEALRLPPPFPLSRRSLSDVFSCLRRFAELPWLCGKSSASSE